MGEQPVRGEIGRGRRSRDDADPRGLQPRVAERIQAFERPSLAIGGGVGRSIIGAGRLDEVVALRDPQDDVAAMRVQGIANKAGRVGIESIGDAFAQLAREKVGDLVLEALAGLVGEREVARIRAGAEHMRIDQFDRVGGVRLLRARAAQRAKKHQKGDSRGRTHVWDLFSRPPYTGSRSCRTRPTWGHVFPDVRAQPRSPSGRADRRRCRSDSTSRSCLSRRRA